MQSNHSICVSWTHSKINFYQTLMIYDKTSVIFNFDIKNALCILVSRPQLRVSPLNHLDPFLLLLRSRHNIIINSSLMVCFVQQLLRRRPLCCIYTKPQTLSLLMNYKTICKPEWKFRSHFRAGTRSATVRVSTIRDGYTKENYHNKIGGNNRKYQVWRDATNEHVKE